jgi:hypothetical protein
MTDLTARLATLGDELERAAARDLRPPRRRSRRVVVGVVAALIAVPGAAIAGMQLTSANEVAQSIPAGSLWLQGTQPTCTVVTEGVEYACALAKAPGEEVPDWKGTVMPTVDASKHVNGGCRSLNSAGTRWRCYLGQAAIDQQIIGPGLLGEFSPTPGVG